MALTEEKIELFAKYLTDDKERAGKLFELSPEEVVETVAKDGIELTVEEVVEFGEKLKAVAVNDGELDVSDLDDVAGGVVITASTAALALAGAALVGKAVAKYRW